MAHAWQDDVIIQALVERDGLRCMMPVCRFRRTRFSKGGGNFGRARSDT